MSDGTIPADLGHAQLNRDHPEAWPNSFRTSRSALCTAAVNYRRAGSQGERFSARLGHGRTPGIGWVFLDVPEEGVGRFRRACDISLDVGIRSDVLLMCVCGDPFPYLI